MQNKQRGLTLLELIITASLIVIITSIAIPSFNTTMENNDADNSIERIFRAWQHAKSLALSKSKQVIICGSDDGTTCKKNWSRHIIIFQDNNHDHIPSTRELVFQYNVNSSQGNIQTRIAFGKAYAIIKSHGQSPFTGSFLYCNKNAQPLIERRVTWNLAGRLYLTGSHLNRTSSSTVKC